MGIPRLASGIGNCRITVGVAAELPDLLGAHIPWELPRYRNAYSFDHVKQQTFAFAE